MSRFMLGGQGSDSLGPPGKMCRTCLSVIPSHSLSIEEAAVFVHLSRSSLAETCPCDHWLLGTSACPLPRSS